MAGGLALTRRAVGGAARRAAKQLRRWWPAVAGVVVLWVLFSARATRRFRRGLLFAVEPYSVTEATVQATFETLPADMAGFRARIERTGTLMVAHSRYRGIRAATLLVGDAVVMTDSWVAAKRVYTLVRLLDLFPVKRIVFQGVVARFDELIGYLRAYAPGVELLHVFHGSPGQHIADATEPQSFFRGVELRESGQLGRLGYVKEGLDEVVRSLGVDAFFVPNHCRHLPVPPVRASLFQPDWFDDDVPGGGRVHIGALAAFNWRKNSIIQLLAACLLGPRATVHITSYAQEWQFEDYKVDFYQNLVKYLDRCRARVVRHGLSTKSDMLELLGRMDINLHASYSECHPMLPMESLAQGVPCLVSNTSNILEEDPFLLDALTIHQVDNPVNIRDHILRTLALGRRQFLGHGRYLCERTNTAARLAWDRFLFRRSTDPVVMPHAYMQPPMFSVPSSGQLTSHTLGGLAPDAVHRACLCTPAYRGRSDLATIVSALTARLVRAGAHVHILTDARDDNPAAWAHRDSPLVHLHFVRGAGAGSGGGSDPRDRSARFGQAVQRLAVQHPDLDFVEFPDRDGLAAHALVEARLRQRGLRAGPPLPPIHIRLGGTRELAAVAADDVWGPGQPLHLYHLERYALGLADQLLARNAETADLYAQAYASVEPHRLVVAPVPYLDLAAALGAGAAGAGARAGGDRVVVLARAATREHDARVVLEAVRDAVRAGTAVGRLHVVVDGAAAGVGPGGADQTPCCWECLARDILPPGLRGAVDVLREDPAGHRYRAAIVTAPIDPTGVLVARAAALGRPIVRTSSASIAAAAEGVASFVLRYSDAASLTRELRSCWGGEGGGGEGRGRGGGLGSMEDSLASPFAGPVTETGPQDAVLFDGARAFLNRSLFY